MLWAQAKEARFLKNARVMFSPRCEPPLECAPSGSGLRNKDLERAAGLGLNLSQHDGWLCWSLLMALVDEGKVEVVRRGKGAIRYFRLKASN